MNAQEFNQKLKNTCGICRAIVCLNLLFEHFYSERDSRALGFAVRPKLG